MYGQLNLIIKSFVEERHGEEKWNKILKRINLKGSLEDPKSRHDDSITQRLIEEMISILGFQREALMTLIGEYMFQYLRKNEYDEMIRNLGSNLLEFIQNLDAVQTYLREEYQDRIAPSFHCDDDSVSDRMVLHYYSARQGYHLLVKGKQTWMSMIKSSKVETLENSKLSNTPEYPSRKLGLVLRKGFIVEAAKDLYNMELKIDLISVTLEEVAIEDGLREHAVFNIIAKKIVEKFDDAPPTFVAQTKKHGENQILKQDVEAVRKKLEQIKNELGENALPVAKYRSARAKWRAIAKVSLLSRGFVPNYPQEIAINPRMFIEVFPYHLIFDPEMKIYQSGLKIQQMMPTIRNRQAEVPKYFRLKYPTHTDFNFENIKKFVMCPFVLEPRKEKMEREWKDRPVLLLKGQMFMLRDKGFFFFISSPHARCWEDLESRKMKLADIPEWDVTRDFLLTEQAYRLGIGHSMFGLGGAMSGSRPFGNRGGGGGGGGNDVTTYVSSDVRDRLNRTQKDLDNERQKNESLYYTFLPRPIADVVRKGTIPGAEAYPNVTALFCDIVHFLPMVAACKPNEVVTVLNSLYTRFDKVTHVHDTFRVESIGDAYMVVSGLPDKIGTHAERICNTALGMNYLATEVKSPLDGRGIQIRIGVHSGSVVWGVVGCRLPRLVVLGETAVVASKLESHGEPGKIHISPSTYRAIKGKGFSVEERGKVDLKGFGSLETYFLLGNEHATEEDLIGRSKPVVDHEISFINEGKEEKPNFDKKRNKNVNQTPSSGIGSRPPTGESDFVPFSY